MKLKFRHGIVSYPKDHNQNQAFLSASPTGVSLTFSDVPLVYTIAHQKANYIIREQVSITNAWKGPFVTGRDYWLYIDIDQLTGARTFGSTDKNPTFGATAPQPVVGQHWFDTNNNVTKVFNGSTWVTKVRLFVSHFIGAAVLNPINPGNSFSGSTVNIVTRAEGGYVLYDATGKALRAADGTLLNTATQVQISGTATTVDISAQLQYATAVEHMPRFSCVELFEFDNIQLASEATSVSSMHGILEFEVETGDVASYKTVGFFTNPAWNWSEPNKPVYFGANGTVVLNAIVQDQAPIGCTVDPLTIYLYGPRITAGTPIPGPQGPAGGGGGGGSSALEFEPTVSSNTRDFVSWDAVEEEMVNVTRKIGAVTHDLSQYDIKHMDGTTQVRTDVEFKIPLHGALYIESQDTTWNEGILIRGSLRGSYATDLQRFRSKADQIAYGDFSVIGGGADNKAESSFATIGGGWENSVIDGISGNSEYHQPTSYSTIGGGMRNSITADWSTIGGGHKNTIDNASNTFIKDKDGNDVRVDYRFMTIGGGECNFASGHYATVGGGYTNSVTAIGSFVGGGQNNGVSKDHSAIAGGINNRVLGYGSFIGAGEDNRTESICATIMVGSQNKIESSAHFSSIINGLENTITGPYSVIVAGASNDISSNGAPTTFSFIGNGLENTVTGSYSALVVGAGNNISGKFNVVGSGENNVMSGTHSAIASGSTNRVSTSFAFIGNGIQNSIEFDGKYGAIVSGSENMIFGEFGFIGNGIQNLITTKAHYSAVVAGRNNKIYEHLGFIGNGVRNSIELNAVNSSIVGGYSNTIFAESSFIGNGIENRIEITGPQSTIVGGKRNNIQGHNAFIGNGIDNTVETPAKYSSIVGGIKNKISRELSFIGNGQDHVITGRYSFIGSGSKNTAGNWHSAIVGGMGNSAQGLYSFIGGGQNNMALDEYSTVIGGYANNTYGKFSQVLGGHHNMIMAHESISVGGAFALSKIRGATVYANGGFPTKRLGDNEQAEVIDVPDRHGEAQSLNLVLRAKSIANTPIQLVTGLTPLGDHEVVTQEFDRTIQLDDWYPLPRSPNADTWGANEEGKITERVHVNVLKLAQDQVISFSGQVVGNSVMDESIVFKFEGAAKAGHLLDGTASSYDVRFIGTPTVSIIGVSDSADNWSLTITNIDGYVGLQVNNTQSNARWVATLQSTQLLMTVTPV